MAAGGNAGREPEYLAPYREAVDRFGPGFEATLWASREYQRTRFRVITEMVDMGGLSVVDAGSGRGDLACYLAEEEIPYRAYLGVEGLPQLLAAGADHLPARAELRSYDFVCEAERLGETEPDVIVFSGSLNTLEQRTAERVLGTAWTGARVALVFNFLSDRCEPSLRRQPTAPARRFDTARLVEWAFRRTARVAVRTDYFHGGHDCTIALWKS
ncbi:MAG: hypothetical protein AB7G17_03835 [Phycisphaerales bacterium]